MKKITKVFSFVLAMLMLVLALPMNVFAKPLYNTEQIVSKNTYADVLAGTPVASFSNLDDDDAAITENVTDSEGNIVTYADKLSDGVTYTDDQYKHKVTAEGDNFITNTKNNKHAASSGVTNLSMSNTSTYTIEFTGVLVKNKLNGSDNWYKQFAAFTFNGVNAVDVDNNTTGLTPAALSIGAYTSDAFATNPKFSLFHNLAPFGTAIEYEIDLTKEHKYVISLNGKDVILFIDGNYVGTFDLSVRNSTSYYVGEYMWLGYRAYEYCDSATAAHATIKNVKVFNTAIEYEVTTTTSQNFAEGDTLLAIDNLYDTTSNADYDINLTTMVDSMVVAGDEATDEYYADGYYLQDDYTNGDAKRSHMWRALGTSLPLNENSEYTITYMTKLHQPDGYIDNFSLVFAASSRGDAQKINIPMKTGDATAGRGYSYNNYAGKLSVNDPWTAYADADGYTCVSIGISGYKVSLKIGEEKVGTFNFAETSGFNFSSDTLTLGFMAYAGVLPTEFDYTKPIASIKDIKVIAGNELSKNKITFKNGGEIIDTLMTDDTELTTGMFPTVTPKTEGNLIKWFYDGTNTIINTPYVIFRDITLEAREISPYDINVAGMQYTTPDSTLKTQSVRFIATIHTLQACEVGFTVYAKYKDGDTVVTRTWDDIKTTKVYTAINATENNTVKSVTANELGGTYLIALAVNNVPTNAGQIDFYITSYIKKDAETTYTSDVVTYSIVNGAYSSTVELLG